MTHNKDVEMDRCSSFEAHTLLCALSVCAAEPSCIVAPVQSSSFVLEKWFGGVHIRGRPCVCVSRLVLNTGECTCLQKLWRFRDWSKSRPSKGSVGNRFSNDGQCHERMGCETFKYSLARYGNTAEPQLFGSFCTLILTQHVIYLQK